MRARLPAVTLAWIACAAAVSLSDSATDALAFDLPRIRQGELWRGLTGHLVHSFPALAALDLGAFLVLGWLLETRRPRLVAPVLLASAAAGSLAVFLARPDLQRYEGSSALSCGLFAALGFVLLGEGRPATRILVIAAFLAFFLKTALESRGVRPTDLWIPEVDVVWSAHLAGAAAGWLVARLLRSKTTNRDGAECANGDRSRRHIAVEPMFDALLGRGAREERTPPGASESS
jgi:rhomboid family GlyGly-CTERM serine protease